MKESYNKALALSFYKDVIGRRDTARVYEIIAENYIQHNPQLKTGRAGVIAAVEYLKKMPVPLADSPSPIRRVIADGDFVALHLVVDIMSKRKFVLDLFRVENGKLAEHWDAAQDEPLDRAHPLSMIDGITEVEDVDLIEANKAAVQAFVRHVLEGHDDRRISELVSDDLIQHDPQIAQGLRGLHEFLFDRPSFQWKSVHRVLGEGSMVVVQSEDGPSQGACPCLFRMQASQYLTVLLVLTL